MRRACSRFVRAAVEGRIVVGAAAAAISAVTSAILGLPVSPALGLVIFAATVLIYGLDDVLDRRGGPRHVPRVVLWTASLSALVIAFTLPHLRLATGLLVALGLPLCAVYAVPLARLGGVRLKDHAIGKVGYVAVAVTTATVLLPCVEANRFPHGGRLLVAAAWVFAAILGNAIACDLRDRDRDAIGGPSTLAVNLGAAATHRLLTGAYLCALPVALALGGSGLIPIAAVIPIAATPLALRLLQGAAPAWTWGLVLDGVFLPMALFV